MPTLYYGFSHRVNFTELIGARQTKRSGGQKGRGLGEGIFARPRFPPPNFVPVKLARH